MNARQSLEEDRAELDMTPMIDVTFLLLIFFMCTLRFKVLEGQLEAFLPKDAGLQETPIVRIEKTQVRIRVVDPGIKMNAAGTAPYADETGHARFTFQGRQLNYAVGTQSFDSLAALNTTMGSFHEAKTRPCVLQTDAGVILADVVPVLDLLTATGFTEITFAGASTDR
jgi:biopolymer transport protein ExbD